MKKFFAVPLAVLFAAACSESSTAPSNLSPSAAKIPAPTTGGCTTGCAVNDTYDFEGVTTASSNTSIGTQVEVGGAGIADAPTVITAPNGQNFIGRFENTSTAVDVNLASGYSNYNLTFDFYVIGSWDGNGKQAQHGNFLANVFDISYFCAATPGTVTSIFRTTFSNQLTVQQDYPAAFGTGGYKAGTGAYGTDLLGYAGHPELSNTPQFRSFGDTEYTLNFQGSNPCGTGAITFVISTSNPTQQSVYDESWGVDNINIKAGI